MENSINKLDVIPGLTISSIFALYNVVNVPDIMNKVKNINKEDNLDLQISESAFKNAIKIQILPNVGIIKILKNGVHIVAKNKDIINNSINRLIQMTGINNDNLNFSKIILLNCHFKNMIIDMEQIFGDNTILSKQGFYSTSVKYKKINIFIYTNTVIMTGTDPDNIIEAYNFISSYTIKKDIEFEIKHIEPIDPSDVTDMEIEI
ncbi:MAG: hypothetical protein Terrestrivirus1_66 [Terrestrivirus sp.]|uniref:Uncharacterized protein n=1 Tax=Terrestrivirus sp. TaxID=2487775 RepID=A0A3G4ZK32_9VIRU|nr:MAG: hypothetical protein Terrestrivirus1_66 [Terrestrivirus sp.]